MSPSPELIGPDAPRNRHHGLIYPDQPVVGWRTASWRNVGKLVHPPNTCHLLVEDLSLTPPASCIPLSYSLAIVQFVTVCFTPDHLLSHSHSPTSIKSLSPIAVSLSRWLPSSLSGKQLFLSAQPTLCLFTGSSSCSRTPPRLLLFILLPRSVPLSSPLIQAYSALFRLYSLPQLG